MFMRDAGGTVAFARRLLRFHPKRKSEAMLFAIDAAQKLGERGESAQVLTMGENNLGVPQWVYGRDPYPPRL
jgi:hypothetical protein